MTPFLALCVESLGDDEGFECAQGSRALWERYLLHSTDAQVHAQRTLLTRLLPLSQLRASHAVADRPQQQDDMRA